MSQILPINLSPQVMGIIASKVKKVAYSVSDPEDFEGYLLLEYIKAYKDFPLKHTDSSAFCMNAVNKRIVDYLRKNGIYGRRDEEKRELGSPVKPVSIDKMFEDHAENYLPTISSIELRSYIERIVDKLTNRDKYIWQMVFVNRIPSRDIAVHLNLTERVMNAYVNRFKVRVKKQILWHRGLLKKKPFVNPLEEELAFIAPEGLPKKRVA